MREWIARWLLGLDVKKIAVNSYRRGMAHGGVCQAESFRRYRELQNLWDENRRLAAANTELAKQRQAALNGQLEVHQRPDDPGSPMYVITGSGRPTL